MPFDLNTAKNRLGIAPGDVTKDAEIQAALDAALAAAEKYCNRNFRLARETARFYHVDGPAIQLSRFPIRVIHSVTPDPPTFDIHYTGGKLLTHDQGFHEVEIDYTGGYDPLPPDLELALWLTFANTHSIISGGAAATLVQGSGDVKSVTVMGSFKLDYDVGTTAVGGGGGSDFGGEAVGFIPGAAVSILDLYVVHGA